MEARAIEQSEDTNSYIYVHIYIYIDMSLYLCVRVSILGPLVFRLIKPSCLQRKGERADIRVRISCFKLLTHLSRASKGRDAISVQKFVKNSGSPKQAKGATLVKATLPVQVAGRGGVRLLSVVPIPESILLVIHFGSVHTQMCLRFLFSFTKIKQS